MNYSLSRYNYPFEKNGRFFLYNLLSASIIEVDAKVYEKICASDLNSLTSDILEDLHSQGFLVEEGTNEVEKYEYYYNCARFQENFHKLKITILPTYACNLACPYCFEGTKKEWDAIEKQPSWDAGTGPYIVYCTDGEIAKLQN